MKRILLLALCISSLLCGSTAVAFDCRTRTSSAHEVALQVEKIRARFPRCSPLLYTLSSLNSCPSAFDLVSRAVAENNHLQTCAEAQAYMNLVKSGLY